MNLLVNIDVDDLENGIRFYTAIADLTVGRRFGEVGVELIGSNAPIYLLAKSAGTAITENSDQRRIYQRHWTPVHLDFVVDDIDQAVRVAIDAGAELEKPISTSKWGKLAVMADPFGHGICFVQFIGLGYDEIKD